MRERQRSQMFTTCCQIHTELRNNNDCHININHINILSYNILSYKQNCQMEPKYVESYMIMERHLFKLALKHCRP